jgi:deoxyribodipyrimidine photolyase-like uncharacterized protein
MLRLFYASIRKKDGEMMKKSSVNLLKYDNGNDEEIRISKPQPKQVLIFPDQQTSFLILSHVVDIMKDNISELMKSKIANLHKEL